MRYNFGEKKEEYNARLKKEVPVWQSPKYISAKEKAIDIIENGQYGLQESDFWILMNATKSGKMAYTGLILSHNGCLKINDLLPDDKKFRPECVTVDKEGFEGSLVYTYCCTGQGLYEVGEVSRSNCQNSYPYAMAFKRLFDRVVLKQSKLAYAGIYSDSESDEFIQRIEDKEPEEPMASDDQRTDMCNLIIDMYGRDQAQDILEKLIGRRESKGLTMQEYAKAMLTLTEEKDARNGL